MARQPISSKYPKTGFVVGDGAGSLKARPKAASLIAQCLAEWSEAEFQIGRLLATMLKADSEPTIALYFTLNNEKAKRDALVAIADYTMQPRAKQVFDLIVRARDSVAKQRADLAHGLYCLIDDEPNGIGWMSTKHRIKNWSDVKQQITSNGCGDYGSVGQFISVYEIQDLENLLNEINEVKYTIIQFNLYLEPGTGHYLDSEALDQLLKSPLALRFQNHTDTRQKSCP